MVCGLCSLTQVLPCPVVVVVVVARDVLSLSLSVVGVS